MRFINRSSIPTFLISLVALWGAVRPAAAQQTTWDVSNAADLTTALAGAFNNNVANPSLLNTITLTGSISGTSQWIVNANVNIVGNGHVINMNNADRAFFIAGGTVGINNLTIQNGFARGGTGYAGAGGGAGLGGAIFVGSGTYYGGVDPVSGTASVAALGISAPAVTLSGVAFSGNGARGGNSPTADQTGSVLTQGGGGGMGGDGGQMMGSLQLAMGMGGGGFGNGAAGSGYPTLTMTPAGSGAMVNVTVPSGATTTAGPGGNGSASGSGGLGSPGGILGGGGGSGGDGVETQGSGGGGGVGGGRGYFANGTPPTGGGNGGFGGGGGGAAANNGGGGNGGFGGGGGNSQSFSGGSGGFGGGGGGYTSSYDPGPGGFGAGRGSFFSKDANGGGGGGLGAGGAVFVMNGANVTVVGGAFTGNTVTAGQGYIAGSAYGADLFSGANVTYDVPTTLVLTSLGGAGNTSDVNITNNYGVNLAGDPNANGGLIKTGSGTLMLTGTSFYSGITTVHLGTLVIGGEEQGTTVVTIGQNAGDDAMLQLGSSSVLTLGGFNGGSGTDAPLVIAQAAGSTGMVMIGAGPDTSGADIGARVFTGGAGNATVVFTQQYAAGSSSNPVYPFFTTLTGSLGIVQEGLGTTSLEPLYGANTFAGPVTVDLGTLATKGTAAALGGVTSIAVNAGGVLALGQTGGVNDLAAVTLAGGVLQTGTSLSETLGALNVTAASIIDFFGNSSLGFSSLSLGGPLSIWNYSGANDFLSITSGTATGSLSQIAFYSDAGTTYLGEGGFAGTRLVPVAVPEPAAIVLVATGLGGLVIRRWRRRMR